MTIYAFNEWGTLSLLPHYYNESVEYVETIFEIFKDALGYNLEQHFHAEETAEEKIAILESQRQPLWLLKCKTTTI